MMKKILLFTTILGVIAFLGSCSPKRLTYLQDMDPLQTYEVAERPDAHITVGDKISITVTCSNPALAAPFTIVSGLSVVDPITGQVTMSSPDQAKSYTVDKKGDINFPVLGYIHVDGFTIKELEDYITNAIIESGYIKDPVVLAEFTNFQITMLGEIGTGNYIINSGSINILEAIALGGDLQDTAMRDKVWVIRTENGTRRVIVVNLLSKDLYNSEAFYLQQGDVIYAKPRKTKFDPTTRFVFSTITSGVSLISSLATIFFLITRITKAQ
ncbi:MAG: polysaccharide biosynthesis/export family protein [Bacteroidales bacterium]|nr:polysaccharide biosynthesis/export family protein [Bacteroidales bacterium]